MSKFKALFFLLTSAGKKYKLMRWRISRSLTAIDCNAELFKRTPTLVILFFFFLLCLT